MSTFKCKKCGKCCSNYLPLKQEEIKTMKKLAKKENKLVLDKNYYLRCPFLNNNNTCDIYENRPMICRGYDCNKFEEGKVSQNMIKEIQENSFKLVDVRKEIFESEE